MYLTKPNDPRLEEARSSAGKIMAEKSRCGTKATEFPPSTIPPVCSCGDRAWPDDFKYCERCGKQLPGMPGKRAAA